MKLFLLEVRSDLGGEGVVVVVYLIDTSGGIGTGIGGGGGEGRKQQRAERKKREEKRWRAVEIVDQQAASLTGLATQRGWSGEATPTWIRA